MQHGCVPASDRLGPFGHSSGRGRYEMRDWSSVRWGQLQNDCARDHFGEPYSTRTPRLPGPAVAIDEDFHDRHLDDKRTGRTAVVLRTWDAYQYYDNQMAWLRSMVTELSLDTGGRFQVFLLVDVKDRDLDLSDDRSYEDVLQRAVPEEFHDITLLFNERLLRAWFPKVGEYSAQDQMYQALQIFSHTYPEFDHVWQLEMDARFTGNIADMLTNAGLWAEKQRRQNLWERNARWYIPGLWNDYEEFSASIDAEFSNGEGIWGPHPEADLYIKPQGPPPPNRSHTSWGVGEPADLINFAPLIDPVGTNWTYEHHVRGFQPAFGLPHHVPRRMAMISMTRTSRRLLRLISMEQRTSGSWVVSESTPETWSLLHGLKAVYVPHLLAFNLDEGDDLTPQQLDQMVHKGPAESRAGGELTGFLWCGNENGMPEPRWLRSSYFFWAGDAPEVWWLYTNGTCTHPLLLHPVKDD